MQLVTCSCGMPLHALVHFLSSSLATPADHVLATHPSFKDMSHWELYPFLWLLAMAYLRFSWSYPFRNVLLHQWFGGARQGHPMWIFLVRLALWSRRSPTGCLDWRTTKSEWVASRISWCKSAMYVLRLSLPFHYYNCCHNTHCKPCHCDISNYVPIALLARVSKDSYLFEYQPTLVLLKEHTYDKNGYHDSILFQVRHILWFDC